MSETDDIDAPPAPSITGSAFWALMTRWQVPDEVALRLIDGPPMSRTGKRPRFRLVGLQVATYEMLRGIDRHLEDLHGRSVEWLSKPVAAKPFGRKTPVAFMAAGGGDAIGATLRFLEREAFKRSLERSAG